MAAIEFSPALLKRVALWSVLTALVGGLIGWVVTGDALFVASVAIGAAIDILTFGWTATALSHAGSPTMAALPSFLLVIRLLIKGLALVLAILFPGPLNIWGMLVGVLAVEATLVILGLALGARHAAKELPHRHREA